MRFVIIFKSVRKIGKYIDSKVVKVNPDSGFVCFETYSKGPRGGIIPGCMVSFTTEEFKIIADRVAEIKLNPSIISYENEE
jgi:hypothetical protein